MLQKKNISQDLKNYTKDEPRPKFINAALESYYKQTDLSLRYVFDCCFVLKPLKGIDVNEQQVQFWYIEFIKMGWKKKDFDKQFEALKRSSLFGRIDLENWLKTEIMYNEIDLNIKIQERIDSLIQRGKFLKDKEVELSEEDKKAIDLAVAKEIELGYQNGWYEKRDNYKEERKKRILGL